MDRLKESTLARSLGAALVFAAIGLALVWTVDDFTASTVATLAAYICVALGLTVLVGGNGQISLGHAALMAVGAYSMAKFVGARRVERTNPDAGPLDPSSVTGVTIPTVVMGLVVAVLVTALVGAVIGVAAARLRGPYLAGATLALGVAVHGVVTYFSDFLKGEEGLDVYAPFIPAGLADREWKPDRLAALIAVVCAALVLLLMANLKRSGVGRHLGAVRDNEIAAQLCGLAVPREQVRAFAVSAATAGLGGGLIGLAAQKANPGTYSLVLSLTLLGAVVIGGLGSLRGAIWGCIVVVLLQRYLGDLDLNQNAPAAVYGLLLIVVMLAAPGGIQGQLSRLGGVLRRRTPQPQGGN
ncbi:MAG TPA: branched-chain amino acid ABC transporter permease [Nocardioides sp.]|nr:branched-chain amino acid ABC transporter permease [Nocardioides sp.]